jgi:hypothetical protein
VNLDAERFVFGVVMTGGADFGLIERDLSPGDFSLESHRRIFSRMADLYKRGECIDRVTLGNELMNRKELDSVGGLGYVNSLDDGLPYIPNLDSYIRIVKRMSTLRRIIMQCDVFGKQAQREDDPELLIASGAKFFQDLGAVNGQRSEAPPSVPQWPDPLHDDAFHGVAGDLVRILEPHTESDPAALLVQSVVSWGNMAGRGPYYLAEADRHHTNEFAAIVGVSSKARKGTSWGRIRGVLTTIDQHWSEERLLSGVGSGEALIDALGEEDKRTLISESELARLLAVIGREGCTLSAIMRDAWDTGIVSTRTRQHPVRAKGVHLSMISHITREELLRRLSDTELANGWANRVLWICARRTKLLPDGGGWPDLGDIARRMSAATDHARRMGDTRVQWDDAAAALWRSKYADLSEGKPGLLGAVTSRAEAHVVRLALTFALLDCAEQICVEHLRAALAVWDYCAASARFIWGDALGDPTADEIRRALAATKLSRTEIRDVFGRNRPAQEIDRALGVLASMGLARSWTETSGGRPVTWWERM